MRIFSISVFDVFMCKGGYFLGGQSDQSLSDPTFATLLRLASYCMHFDEEDVGELSVCRAYIIRLVSIFSMSVYACFLMFNGFTLYL